MSSQSEPNKDEPNKELIDAALLRYWENEYQRQSREDDADFYQHEAEYVLERLISSAELGGQD